MQVMPNLSYSGITKAPTFSAPINSFGSIGSACSLSGNQSLFNGSFVRRDDSLKSVPPRFIFPTVRPEGKVRTVCVCRGVCVVLWGRGECMHPVRTV